MDYAMRAGGAKLLLLAAALGLGLIAAPQARAEGTCKTVTFFPGVVQVYGTVRANAGTADSQFCTTSFACPQSTRKVEVFGGAVASSPDAVVAVDNTALLSSGDEISANCLTTPVGSHNGVTAGTCNNKAETTANQGTAERSQCSVFIDAPAGASVGANATCFCGT